MRLVRLLAAAVAGLLLAHDPPQAQAQAQTRLIFGTNWLAQAEHGGFYQAVALGFYRAHGLDVTIRMGGPNINPALLVATGVTDLQMSPNSFGAFNLARQGIPVRAVAAFFQKDPTVLIAHPGAGNDSLAALRGKPVMISATARDGYWLFLRARFGFTDDQIRPYNFSLAPYLANKHAIQQGFLTTEPGEILRQTGEAPVVHLLADSGYTSYANLVLARTQLIDEHPDIVAAFIDASIEGWYSFLYGDPAPAIALIQAANKDMSRHAIDDAIALMKQHGIADSGDSLTLGIGAMTEARWRAFFATMEAAGVYPPDMDWKQAFTLQFVNHRHGLHPPKSVTTATILTHQLTAR